MAQPNELLGTVEVTLTFTTDGDGDVQVTAENGKVNMVTKNLEEVTSRHTFRYETLVEEVKEGLRETLSRRPNRKKK